MQNRERLLAIIVVALLAIVGGQFVVMRVLDAFSSRRQTLDRLTTEVAEKEGKSLLAARAQKQLKGWEKQSLPSDVGLATTKYSNWLLTLARDAGFAGHNVKPNANVTAKKGASYVPVTFTVDGQGNVDQVTKFLFNFYKADMLHEVRAMSLTPMPNSKDLKVSFTIEALVMPTADPKKELNKGESGLLASKELADYQKVIVGRNLYAEYTPPAPPRPPRDDRPRGPSFDAADYAYVTAIIVDGQQDPHVWINLRTTNELLMLKQGQEFKVGELKATVARINASPRTVEIQSGQERRRVQLGQNLKEGTALPGSDGT